VVTGVLFFVLAEIGYRSAQVFYNSLLPDIAHLDEMGHVSGNGWAIGSLGGIVCLLIVLAFIMLVGGPLVVRLSFAFTAVFFAASAAPLFLFLRERTEARQLPKGENYLSLAFKRLGKTFRTVKTHREFIRFIIAFLIYNDGIMMTMNFAAIIGAVLFGMQQQQLIIFMIVVQVTSVAGAWGFGKVAARVGGKRSLLISLFLMILTVLTLLFVQNIPTFYVIGAMAGFALTGVQSVSRTLVGQLAPEGQSAEFYGFYSMAGRTSSFLGPTVYGWLAAFLTFRLQARGVESLLAEQMGTRYAVISIAAFLLIGSLILLLAVHDPTRLRQHDAELAAEVE
jgi:UMF1 family MFS transporter